MAIIAGLVVLTTALLVASAFGVPLPGGTLVVPSVLGSPPDQAQIAIVIFLWLAMAALSASALALAARPDVSRPRLITLLVGLITFTFVADQVSVGDVLHRYESFGIVNGSIAVWRVFHAAGWIGAAAALIMMLMPVAVLRSHVLVPLVLGAAPYLLGLAAFLVAGDTTYQLPSDPTVGTAQGLAARPFLDNGQILSFAIVVLVFWQAATWARAATRDIGLRVSSVVRRWPLVLLLLLLAKFGFLAVGYALANDCASSASDVWTISRCDHPITFLIAALFVTGISLWLLKPERLPLSDRRLPLVAAGIVTGFALVLIGLLLLRPAATLVGLVQVGGTTATTPFPACLQTAFDGGPGSLVFCATSALEPLIDLAPLATVVAAALLGMVIAIRRGLRSVALLLLVFAIWAAPRALDVLFDRVGVGTVVPNLGMELATFDAALTIAIAILALASLKSRGRSADPAALSLALVVSTLIAHGGTLVPGDWQRPLFFLLLAAPLIYTFVFDARGLNVAGPDRPTRVLAGLVGAAALLTLATAGVVLGTRSPTDYLYERYAGLLFLVPFAVIVVGARITDIRAARSLETAS